MKNLKSKITAAILACTMMIGLTACGKPEGVAAEVNGEQISMEDYQKEYAAVRNSFVIDQGAGDPAILKEALPNMGNVTIEEYLREMTLENLIKERIVIQDAEKYGVKVSDEEVDNMYNNTMESAGGEQLFIAELKKQGLTPEFFKNFLKKKIMIQKYYEEKMKDITPNDEDIKKYYEEHKDDYFMAEASHILVDTEKEAKDAKKKLDEGADFAKLAKEISKDPTAKENGGSLGEFPNGAMVPEFNDAIVEMKPGEISKPIETQFGYHIIELKSKTERKFEDVKEEIKNELLMQNEQKYNEKLEKEAKVKKYVDLKKVVEIPEEYKMDFDNKEVDKNSENTTNNKADKNAKSNELDKNAENAKK